MSETCGDFWSDLHRPFYISVHLVVRLSEAFRDIAKHLYSPILVLSPQSDYVSSAQWKSKKREQRVWYATKPLRTISTGRVAQFASRFIAKYSFLVSSAF